MEPPSLSTNSPKSKTSFPFPQINLLQTLLILNIIIPISTSIQPNFPQLYSQHCNHLIPQPQSTKTQIPINTTFLQLDLASYTLPSQTPQFNFNPNSPQTASFSVRKAFSTLSVGNVEIHAVLNLIGPRVVEFFSGASDTRQRKLRLVKARPPRFTPGRAGAEFVLLGYWNMESGKVCMVGTGSGSLLRSVEVVVKLDFPNLSVIGNSLVNGSVESVPGGSLKFISLLGVSRMGYSFTYVNEEMRNGGFSEYDGMENVSLGLPDTRVNGHGYGYGHGICSIVTWGLRFEMDYENYRCENVSCSFGTVGDEVFPRFMSVKVVDCLEDGKVRYILQFTNETFGKGLAFYPLTALVAEGEWDEEKKRVVLVACRVIDKMSIRGCSIRLAFSFPASLSLRRRSSIVGKMWSTETKSLGYVSFYSTANVNSRIKETMYEYTEHEKVQNLCGQSLESKRKKGTYPDEKSPNLRFDMTVRNKRGQTAYGYASPLYIGDKFYTPFVNQWNHSSSGLTYINVSYVISFTTRDEFDFGGKIARSKMVEISAEGVYNTKNGVICMIGCKHMPYEKYQKKSSLDCELAININFSPLNSKDEGMIRGNIKSTRKKPDPLYFEPIEFGSSSITTIQARESIWRMDLEITMVLISNTLACIFVGLQLFHVKRYPDMLPFISIVMLVVLTLAHMIPLVLNFEAIFMVNRKQNVFLGTDQWLEVNEVLVRVITMIAFLLQFRLLQLTWSSRNGHDSKKTIWVSDKKVLYISCPIYIAIGLVAWLAHSLQSSNSHTKRFRLPSKNVTFWGALKSYTGLVLDTFLIPQILFNLFYDTHETVLAPSFYIGSTVVRLLPRVYDLYRTHSSSWVYDKIYANPGMDYYSTMWDVVICCAGMVCVIIVYVQQRFGGRSVLPKRFRDNILYHKVPDVIREQQIF